MTFDGFASRFRPDVDVPDHPWLDPVLTAVAGYVEFATRFAGQSFEGGLYRVHSGASGPLAQGFVCLAYPELAERVRVFGYDWLGRQLAIDLARTAFDEPMVLLLEIGTGEALEVPATFEAFHETELRDHADAALASGFFEDWRASVDDGPLLRSECAGYRLPLFLGGSDTVGNLERVDIEVYWHLMGQLRVKQLRLLPGTHVSRIRPGG